MNLQNMVLDVEEYTRQRLVWYSDELRELYAIDTYTYHKAGLDEMARLLAARMRGLGMDTTIIENEVWGNDLLGVYAVKVLATSCCWGIWTRSILLA